MSAVSRARRERQSGSRAAQERVVARQEDADAPHAVALLRAGGEGPCRSAAEYG
jgi:hypothetical protein